MPTIPQVRRIEFNDEEIGMGFNSETGLAVGTALEDFTVQENPSASGQEVLASITIVNSHEELMKSLGMSFEAQGRYGFFSASAKAQFSESSNYNSTSTFLVARCIVQNPLTRGKNFRVTTAAKELLDAIRFEDFQRAFGDSFVRGLQTGGEFYSVVRITSVSISKQSELGATLQAEYNGLAVGGSFEGQFAQANLNTSTRSEFTATMYQKAGSGAQISPTVQINEVINRFKNFPEIAKASAAAYETEVATYDTLPLPVPPPEEQEDFVFALRDAREKKLRYIQTRNDLEFALRNPIFFIQLPENEVLLNAILVYTKLINAVMEHAIKLSRGQMKPPRLFDPSEVIPPLVEPAPIPLPRVTPLAPPTIPVPDMVGLTDFDILEALQCLSQSDVDTCLQGMVIGFVTSTGEPLFAPPLFNISREVAEFLKIVATGNPRLTFSHNVPVPGKRFRIIAQFPFAGNLMSGDDEVVLQVVEVAV